MDDPARILERTLSRTRRRLRLRAVVRSVSVALQLGLAVSLPVALAAKLAGLPWLLVLAVVAVWVCSWVAVGAALGLIRGGYEDREVALLVDRVLGTDELLLTATHVAGTQDPNRTAIFEQLSRANLGDPRRQLQVRPPAHLRMALVSLGVLLLIVGLVPKLGSGWLQPPEVSELVAEGERLEERLTQIQEIEGAALPKDLERQVEALTEELRGDELTPEEAKERLGELQEQLAAFDESMESSASVLEDLEDAARALDAAATEQLSKALEDGDMDAAAEAAQDLSESLAAATPEERAAAAEALEEAGKALQGSGDPAAQQAGEALEKAGQQMKGEPGAPQGGSASPTNSDAGVPKSLTPQQAAELAQQLKAAQAMGEQLQQDKAALQRSQEINGALEGSRQRLGGEPQVAQGEAQPNGSGGEGPSGEGEGSADGSGKPDAGQGSGEGPGSEGTGSAAAVGSSGHTWEDEGESTASNGGKGSKDRNSDRTSGQHVDDFQKLYESVRLQGANGLLAGVEGQVNENGVVDHLPVRLTGAEEAAKVGTIDLPAQYRKEAAEAVEAEPIPPAYQQAVKEYFDAME